MPIFIAATVVARPGRTEVRAVPIAGPRRWRLWAEEVADALRRLTRERKR